MRHPIKQLSFKAWLLESAVRDILQDVPQDPSHHPEGNTFRHVMMVRKSLDRAVELLRNAQQQEGSAFEKLDLNLDKTEYQILQVAAWMHDIGKAGTTTLNIDGEHTPWQDVEDPSQGRWQALQHERPKYYKPQMRELGAKSKLWKSIWDNTEPSAKKDVLFVINHHMGLRNQDAVGFGHRLSSKESWIDPTGKYVNRRRLKLLLIFVLMDRLGRGEATRPVENAEEAIASLEGAAIEVKRKREFRSSEPAPDDHVEFLKVLASKNMTIGQVVQAFQGKFKTKDNPKPTPTKDELEQAGVEL